MRRMIHVLLLLVSTQILDIAAQTDSSDLSVLNALKRSWRNLPPDWKGSDPCGSSWEGISCRNSRVTSLILAGMGVTGTDFGDISSLNALQYLDLSNNMGLRGTLPSSIGNLRNLTTLILIGCSFSGPIPDSIGSLSQLVYIGLNKNNFVGPIPPSLGNLARLSWLDLSDNQLSGGIPVSDGTTPGLDMLVTARHFHLSKNQLSGTIPRQLFSSSMRLIHVVLDNNRLNGSIPPTLGLVGTLVTVRLDWNSLSGSVPQNLNNLTNVTELNLSNNNLTGAIPDLTGMNILNYVDMSNNNFNVSDVPSWFTELQSLTTLLMGDTNIQGNIPSSLFLNPSLETVELSNNRLNGTLDIGTSYSTNLTLDLQNNSISGFRQSTGYNLNLTLVNNPICQGAGTAERYCTIERPNSPYVTPPNNCVLVACRSNQLPSPNCRCAHPYVGTIHFFSYSFSNLENASYFSSLQGSLMSVFLSNGLPVDSISLSNPTIDVYSYLSFRLQIFPSGQNKFNRTSVGTIGSLLNRQLFPLQHYGPFFFLDESYCCFAGESKSANVGIIVGATIGSCVLVLLILGAGLYAFSQKRKAEKAIKQNNPFASWGLEQNAGSIPQLKGARWFSFDEINKCSNSFSEANIVGAGGYGQVYKGNLSTGEVVAIKRAQQGSLQGATEFKTEIELLSRIHHVNVVGLVGFCYEQGEQMLVYEYMSNGTLKDVLSGKSKMRLDWMTRLGIALEAAKGLAYLHELADPPIIHRDVKSTNILLDQNLIAKVADFGLSKLVGDTAKGYISTQVKGTLGYMDPEYYMTQQLTDKSDVYSFGVVLLELLTARAPIQKGKYIVKEVRETKDKLNDTYDLHKILDPVLASDPNLEGITKFVNLAMSCVKDSSDERPRMSEVVREIENIIQLARKNIKPASTLPRSHKEETDGDLYNAYGENDHENYDSYGTVTDSDYSRPAVSFGVDLR